ncbi:MAG TPA: hypothetical protein VJQ50_03895 [Terriglobales bacterium]|nr:hypothetical protein [Terriglobales bacterium]
MKSKLILLAALLAFFVGLGVLIVSWQGNSSVSVAWPVSGSTVQVTGSAKGWHAVTGLAGLLLAPVLLLWGLMSLATGGRRRQREPLPEPQARSSPEVKKEAASH